MAKEFKILNISLICLSIVTLLLSAFHFILFDAGVAMRKDNFRLHTLSNSAPLTLCLKIHKKLLFKNTNGMEWDSGNDEVIINNNHFEISEIRFTQDSVNLLLLEDLEEDEFFRKYFILAKHKQKQLTDITSFLMTLAFEKTKHIAVVLYPEPTASYCHINTSGYHFDYHFEKNDPPEI